MRSKNLSVFTKNRQYFKLNYMKNLHLPLVIEEDEDGIFIISCPSFKGCHSYGKTIDEALINIREAIDLCLEETSPQEINKFVGFRELEIVYNA